MKISAQEKIAELERRIAALEAERRQTTRTINMSGSRLVPMDTTGAWSQMWTHFDAMFAEMGKLFR